MEHKMSINLNRPIVPAIAIEMISGRTRLIGIPKEKIQVVITLPDINEFNKELNEAIEFFKHRADSFIITSSNKEECNEVIDKFDLNEHLISNEHRDFSKIFKMRDETRRLKKSLMIIDTNCQITHKDVL
jgi:hypothetical protein